MGKKCIFCGKTMEEKTKEHVIPQWLIKMTGDKNRVATFGIDYSKIFNDEIAKEDIQRRKYSFLNFTFPACKRCNETYGSTLEADMLNILTKVINEQKVNHNDIVNMLDWFDKVRIGLWLGYLYYNEQLENIEPKFYINDRVGLKDRALYIYKCEEDVKGINFVGPGGMLFSMIPSCFLMRINNYFFLNISTDFLLLKDLGFPYPEIITIDEDGHLYDKLVGGNKEINQDILSQFKIKNTSKAIFQPVFKQYKAICELDDTYVRNNSIAQAEGNGCIYIRDKEIHKMEVNEEYLLSPDETYVDAASLLQSLGIKVSKILKKLAIENCNMIDQSSLPNDIKERMNMQLQEAIIVENLRMKRAQNESKKKSI